jgi:hypothetical protein
VIAELLLAAAAAQSPVDAERAFAADAQKIGQWTAFRNWSAPDAVMFVPQQVNAHAFLKDRKDPATAVFWWPGRSYLSCDGSFAVNTGPWVREWGKSVGYFTTVWRREGETWRWIYDAGDALQQARGEGGDIQPQRASCAGRPHGANVLGTIGAAGYTSGGGRSKDGTLVWSWAVGPKGQSHFLAQAWDGKRFNTVVEDRVAAPAP